MLPAMTPHHPGGGPPDPPQHDGPGSGPPSRPPRETDGWAVFSYLLGGMILYGGIGWVIGHFTGISILFPLGMILGIGLAIALIIFRFTRS
jgi:ATP synthase protein I